jgi:hypothetical protein
MFYHYGSALNKTVVSCLITNTSSIPLDILIPWVAVSYSTT